MRNGLHRHYGKLTPEERFRLDVLAMARGDEQEAERLVSSCPKFSYTMTDNAFSGRWLRVMDMTLRLYVWPWRGRGTPSWAATGRRPGRRGRPRAARGRPRSGRTRA